MLEEKNYPIDYEAYDLKSLFSIRKAALLWYDLEIIQEKYRKRVDMLEEELKSDIFIGKLKYRTLTDYQKSEAELYKLPTLFNDFTDCLSREDLRAWAIARGHRPKFLFPEDRGAEFRQHQEMIPPEAPKKPIAPRPNQIIKACCQTVALMLWDQNPAYSQKQIVAHPAMKKYGYQNATFDERTLLLWVSDVDPRPPEVKKTPFSKKAEIA